MIIFLCVSFDYFACLLRNNKFAQVRKMEEEQEEMGNSLMALTSHYAKVQLRLQQVVSAPVDSREELLKDLNNFASMGIPDLRGRGGGGGGCRGAEEAQEEAVAEQRRKQAEAIVQLRAQLEELENYAYQVRIVGKTLCRFWFQNNFSRETRLLPLAFFLRGSVLLWRD